ncbi:MAG TPA: hypothetical protein VFR47_23135 [Anaerolineales bacterium]|nr:hypothetical protein [Anaerolineales bacterium]
MKTHQLFLSIVLAVAVLAAQVGPVFAAPAQDPSLTGEHPVASALAEYFSQLGVAVNYDMIMVEHEQGFGFGVIAQSLWLTLKINATDPTITFQMILAAKKDGDYSKFFPVGTTPPTNWGQFRKLILDGDKKNGLGAVMSEKEHGNNPGGNGNNQENGNGNGGNGNGYGQGNGHGNGNPNDNDNNENKGNGKNK